VDETPQQREDRHARRTAQAKAFDQIGARYDEAFPHKDGQVEATESLAARLESGARVLDVGCGTGLPTARILCDAGLEVTGIDISAGMLDLARRNVPEASLHQVDLLDLDSTFGSFDGAVAFFSLLMLPRAQLPQALHQLGQLLRPGAPLVLGMVEADVDDVPIPFLGATVRVTGYPRTALEPLLAAGGFAVDDIRDRTYEPVGPGAQEEVQLFVTARRC
jgi:ubiquinone/menaquinone biosynthesis C-methylase UbiE